MPPRKKTTQEPQPELPTGYSYDEAASEIRRVVVDELHLDLKQLAAEIGEDYKAFVRALNRSENRDFLNIEQLGKVAKYVSARYRPAPPGWPIQSYEKYDELVRRLSDALEVRSKVERKPPASGR